MGILPVSHTWAKKNILGMSDNEVILDLQQQRMERAIGAELMNTAQIIRRTGVFDDVDKKYGIPEDERKQIEDTIAQGGGQDPMGGGMSGGGGGGGAAPIGGDSMSAPLEGAPIGGDIGGGEAAPLAEEEEPFESTSKKENILSMLSEDTSLSDLFDTKKAQKNIYDIENLITEITKENTDG